MNKVIKVNLRVLIDKGLELLYLLEEVALACGIQEVSDLLRDVGAWHV
jgi:hypothetical protein